MLLKFTHVSPELLQNKDKKAGPDILAVPNVLSIFKADQKYRNHSGAFEQLL